MMTTKDLLEDIVEALGERLPIQVIDEAEDDGSLAITIEVKQESGVGKLFVLTASEV